MDASFDKLSHTRCSRRRPSCSKCQLRSGLAESVILQPRLGLILNKPLLYFPLTHSGIPTAASHWLTSEECKLKLIGLTCRTRGYSCRVSRDRVCSNWHKEYSFFLFEVWTTVKLIGPDNATHYETS